MNRVRRFSTFLMMFIFILASFRDFALAAEVKGEVSCDGNNVGILIEISGTIDDSAAEHVGKIFAEYDEKLAKAASGALNCKAAKGKSDLPDLSGYGDRFAINSRGGSVPAAMAIGRLFRKYNASISVDGICLSSCVFVLAGAVDRYVGPDQVGIHRPYFGTSAGSSPTPEQVGKSYSALLQRIKEYLREMSISTRLADDMLAIEPENVRMLSSVDLKDYRLSGPIPAERERQALDREKRDVEEARQLGLDRDEYTRRKALGSKACAQFSEPRNVLDCQRMILRTGKL